MSASATQGGHKPANQPLASSIGYPLSYATVTFVNTGMTK